MATPLCLVVLMAQTSLGGIGPGHHHAPPPAACCDVCGVRTLMVATEIARLQSCPHWKDRRAAAQRLQRLDWRCHPEVVPVLASAMLHDPHKKVRAASAHALATMAPCMPEAHEALAYAAACSPDHWTRKWASKGARSLSRRCVAACRVCGPAPGAVVVQHVTAVPSTIVIEQQQVVPATPVPVVPSPPPVAPGDAVPRGLPPVVPEASPFGVSPAVPSPTVPLRNSATRPGRPNLASVLLGGR